MSYQYRWIYAAVVIVTVLLVAIVMDGYPLQAQCRQLQLELQSLSRYHNAPAKSTRKRKSKNTQQQLLAILSLAHLEVMKINQDGDVFQLQLQAGSAEMLQWLGYMYAHANEMHVEKIVLRQSDINHMQLLLNLTVTDVVQYKVSGSMPALRLCGNGLTNVPMQKYYFPLASAQMVGVFESVGDFTAFLRWPNGLVEAYRLGDVVETGAGRVVMLGDEGIVLLKSGQIIAISKQNE